MMERSGIAGYAAGQIGVAAQAAAVEKATAATKFILAARELEQRSADLAGRLDRIMLRLRGAIPQEAQKENPPETAPNFMSALRHHMEGIERSLVSAKNAVDELETLI